MAKIIDGNAVVYCQGAFNTPNGKTAHGLVRFTKRYNIIAVIDSNYQGHDSGEILDGKSNGIKIFGDLSEVTDFATQNYLNLSYFVIGLAPDGGRLPQEAREVVKKAITIGLNVDSGLHSFLTNDKDIMELATKYNCSVRDIRKTKDRDHLHFFTGRINEVSALKIAILGTDSAIGKRTTAWLLVHGLNNESIKTELIGTGQTAWLQGAKYSMIMDSCINDFVSGEIENAVLNAWDNEKPEVIIIEGQGSLLNPAYPGGFEILAAGRPDYVILQHAPKRTEYDGFQGYKLHSLKKQIEAIEIISEKKVIAITINHEDMQKDEILPECEKIAKETGIPAFDVLAFGTKDLVKLIKNYMK